MPRCRSIWLQGCVLSAALTAVSVSGCKTEAAGAQPSRSLTVATTSKGGKTADEPSFFGQPDEPIRRVLATAPIEKVKKGAGGRSLAFKLTLAGGVEGYFKPEQTFASNWFSELASYYLDRELGFGRTPPAIGRRIEWKRLSGHAARDDRLKEIVVKNGFVRGSLVWWVPEKLVPLELPDGWEAWLRVEGAPAVSPFGELGTYVRARRRPAEPAPQRAPAQPRDFPDRPAELSDLILFDYLIGNLDRWGGGFTNVRALGTSKALMYLDNANGFHVRQEPSPTLEARLAAVQRFRKSTVTAIRRLDVDRLERRMSKDPLAPLLSEAQLDQLEVRRRRVVEHITDVQRRYGERATPW
jgi:hypothetical protein